MSESDKAIAAEIVDQNSEPTKSTKAKRQTAVAKAAPVPSVAATPMAPDIFQILGTAVANGGDAETIKTLIEMKERLDAAEAKKAFDLAFAAAQDELPVILKNRVVDFTSTKGRTHYRYEDLAEIQKVVRPVLGAHGLSYRFRTTSKPNEPVIVTCIVSHKGGHSEETELSAGRDDSGNKNSIQAIGSTLTYLQRMTLKAALGLSAAENDDDGRASDQDAAEAGFITEAQRVELCDLADAGGFDKQRFCQFLNVPSMAEIPASMFDRAKAELARAQAVKRNREGNAK